MKICLIVDDYLPCSIKVAAKMMHELAVGLIAKGNEVSVVTPSTDVSKSFEVVYLDKVKIYKFKSGEIKNVSKISQLFVSKAIEHRMEIIKK